MENALLVGLSRQIALGRELDVIANNVANVTTNGFKARSSRFQDFVMPKARVEAFQPRDRQVSFVIDSGTQLDTSPGAIEATGNPLDAAIKGDGFFVVQTPAGERFTRNGAFSINGRGQLVSSDGYPALGDGGPITFGPQEQNPQIASDGTVTTSEGQRGRLRLVRFDRASSLESEGANTFSSSAAPLPAAGTVQVEPGALERSNVKPVLEMSRLIEVNRAYTTVAGMLSRLDELKRTAMTRLADANPSS